jgi:hypothetical protein
VKFIQHKVLQCNKENYGQCFTQGKLKQMILSLIEAYNGGPLSGTTGDRDSDDGRPLSLSNSRRPSISAPISRKSSVSRVHTPPLASPSSHLLEDGTTSTPKRLSEGKSRLYQALSALQRDSRPEKLMQILSCCADNDLGSKRSASPAEDCKATDLDNKDRRNRDSIDIKQERLSALDDDYPPHKRLRAAVADAESNTTNSGELNFTL